MNEQERERKARNEKEQNPSFVGFHPSNERRLPESWALTTVGARSSSYSARDRERSMEVRRFVEVRGAKGKEWTYFLFGCHVAWSSVED